MRKCECGAEMPPMKATGRTAKFCSNACRQRAYRKRRPAMPKRMTDERRWVRADGKRPITPSGSPASSTDPTTWSSYAAVRSGAGDGFGVMLGGGLACWDLDSCLTGGELEPWARKALARIKKPIWVEVSISGSGLHVFVESPEAPGRVAGNVEFYSRERFIRVTGVVFDGA